MTENGRERAKPLRAGDPHELGGYRIEGRLGRGGMGTVYLARDTADRLVAVKLIHPDLSDDPDFRRRFAREVESARKVARFSTAGVLDARLDGDPLLIISEYVPGPNLSEAISADGPMAGGTLESLALGVAAALTAIHRSGVIHRDLKPGNVLLSAVGPKVIDFGIARAMDDESAVTRSSQLMGTPSYLAPELIAGGAITPASDIFSWGCLVAYAGTGKAPFGAPSIPAVLNQISTGEAHLEGLDARLVGLTRSALDKDPRNRPSAQQLLNTLVGQEDPAEAIVDSTVVKSWTPPSTARSAGDGAAGAAAAAGAAGAAAATAASVDPAATAATAESPDTAAASGAGAEPEAGTGSPTIETSLPVGDAAPTEQATRAIPPGGADRTPATLPSPTRPDPEVPTAPASGPQAPYGHNTANGPGPAAPAGPHPQEPPAARPGADWAGHPPPGGRFPPSGAPPQHYGPPPGPAAYGPGSGPQAPMPYGPPSGPQQPYSPGLQPPHGVGPPPFGQPAAVGGGSGPPGETGGASAGGPAPRKRRTAMLLGAGAAVLVLIAGGAAGVAVLLDGPPEGTLVYEDDFAGGAWDYDLYEPDDDSYEYAYHPDHGLMLRVSEYNSYDGSIGAYPPYEGEYPESVLVRAEAEPLAGPLYSEYGVRCWRQESDDEDIDTHYEGLVRFDGGSAQIRRAGGESGQAALAETDDVSGFEQPPGKLPLEQNNQDAGGGDGSDAATNTLTMTCEPAESGDVAINLWVNGEHVLEAVDTKPLPDNAADSQARMVGVTVKRRGSETDTPAVGFHRFEVQRLGEPGSTAGDSGG